MLQKKQTEDEIRQLPNNKDNNEAVQMPTAAPSSYHHFWNIFNWHSANVKDYG